MCRKTQTALCVVAERWNVIYVDLFVYGYLMMSVM